MGGWELGGEGGRVWGVGCGRGGHPFDFFFFFRSDMIADSENFPTHRQRCELCYSARQRGPFVSHHHTGRDGVCTHTHTHIYCTSWHGYIRRRAHTHTYTHTDSNHAHAHTLRCYTISTWLKSKVCKSDNTRTLEHVSGRTPVCVHLFSLTRPLRRRCGITYWAHARDCVSKKCMRVRMRVRVLRLTWQHPWSWLSW